MSFQGACCAQRVFLCAKPRARSRVELSKRIVWLWRLCCPVAKPATQDLGCGWRMAGFAGQRPRSRALHFFARNVRTWLVHRMFS